MSYFDYHTTARRSYSSKFIDEFGAPRSPYEPSIRSSAAGAHYADVAASIQKVLEDTMVDLASALHRETGLADLCLGGGVALNGCANARILRESGFERVFVPPAPGDAGCALGAALLADRIAFQESRCAVSRPSVLRAARRCRGVGAHRRGRRHGCCATSSIRSELVARVAEELHAGAHRRVDARSGRARAARTRTSQHPRRAARGGDAGSAEPGSEIPRRLSTLRSGGSARGGRSLLRAPVRTVRVWRGSCRAFSR